MRSRALPCLAATVFAGLALLAPPARADERILAFHSDITVAADGGMDVTETLRVRSEGAAIRHGIYRDFPTDYKDRNGLDIRVDFTPLALTRDDRDEPFHAQSQSNGQRVYFGSKDTSLDAGVHTYAFRYRTSRQLGFFADHDELYWNVTGTGWDFPIDVASADVTLPGDVSPAQIAVEGYTGPQGAKGKAFRAEADRASHARFVTTRTLAPHEGLTLVVSFPKGVVAAPTDAQRRAWFLHDNLATIVMLAGLAGVLAFYYAQWWRVGRDPKPGVIIPQYEPPEGLTPGALRFVERMGWDDRVVAADVVDLAVRGAVRIVDDAGTWRIERLDGGHDLPRAESDLRHDLLGLGDSLTFKQSEHGRIGQAITAHKKRYETAHSGIHFHRNTRYVVGGVLLTVASLVAAAVLLRGGGRAAGATFMLVWLSGWSVGTIALAAAVVRGWRQARSVVGVGGALFLTLFALPFFAGEVVGLGVLAFMGGITFALGLLALIALNLLFRYLMRAPTPAGRALLDRIEGLRLYMGVAERGDFAAQRGPPVDARTYHRLLPYALALGVERTWTDRFAATVGPAAAAAAAASAGWYAGRELSASSLGGFASGLGSSFGSAISSSSSAPGSSSGSGGGGSSGGGGGGGGGGGW